MSSTKIRFGEFELDPARYLLTRGDQPVRLERIPMDLLLYLVRQQGRLVGRDEIVEQLWGKDVFLDTDNSINTAIRKIRKALGDTPEHSRYLETVPGKGYRFISSTQQTAPQPQPQRVMLAVLPFENLSGDPSQEYFSDGLTEETIMRLGQLSPSQLGVIARTSCMVYKNTDKNVVVIGRELGVNYLLEGSVRRDADRVRVTAQLIRVEDQVHLWAENYDRSFQSFIDLQGEVALAIAEQVQLKLSSQEKAAFALASSGNMDAYDHYLRGRYHYARVSFPELRQAIQHFRQATAHDPNFAPAYAGLADCLVVLPVTSDVKSSEVFPEAKQAIGAALRLDPKSAEAHSSDGDVKFWYDWDWQAAELSFRRSLSLNPNYAPSHLMLAHTLSNIGRHDEALEAIQQARLLDPLSLIASTMHGQFLYHSGQDDSAIRILERTLQVEPHFWVAHVCLAKVYIKVGRYADAIASAEKSRLYSGCSEGLALAGYAHAANGDRAAADALASLHEIATTRYVPPCYIALVYAGLQEYERSLEWLHRGYEERDVHMTFLRDHKWNWLQRTAEGQLLLSRMKLTQPAESLSA